MTPPGYGWYGVLAGAYATEAAMKKHVAHLVPLDAEGHIDWGSKTLCRKLPAERMSDMPADEATPRCPACLERSSRSPKAGRSSAKRSVAKRTKTKRSSTTARRMTSRLRRARFGAGRRVRRRMSKNAMSDTPLAKEYRLAKAAYRKAGRALRSSCSARSRTCGFPARMKMPGRKRFRFIAPNVQAMKQDFLGAPSDTGTNYDAIVHAMGHLDVRDKTQWEPVAEKYEKKGVETFDQAFSVLAKAARRDWRKFDMKTLQECPGMASVEPPTFMHEAKSQEEIEKQYEEAPF